MAWRTAVKDNIQRRDVMEKSVSLRTVLEIR